MNASYVVKNLNKVSSITIFYVNKKFLKKLILNSFTLDSIIVFLNF